MGSESKMKELRREMLTSRKVLLGCMGALDYYEQRATYPCPQCKKAGGHHSDCGIFNALEEYRNNTWQVA